MNTGRTTQKPRGKRGGKKPRTAHKSKKDGGVLPLIPMILAGISALGSAAAGSAQIAKAVNQAKNNAKQLQETQRHNEIIENKLLSGKGLYKKCTKCNGKGLFLGRSPRRYS